jgi:hypothetical protein
MRIILNNIKIRKKDFIMEFTATINSTMPVEIACTHRTYGSGKITELKFTENLEKPEMMMTFVSDSKTTCFAYSIITKLRLLTFDETDTETLQNLFDEYVENWTEYDNARKAEIQTKREAAIEAREAEKRAKAEAQKAEAFEQKKKRDIKDFEEKLKFSKPMSIASEFYISLGWLAKHTGTVSAALPDYLESTFVSHFGDVPRRVVDSTKKGPAGWTSQWTSSFALSLKKPDIIPAMFEQYLNPSRKALTDTSFVWELVDNYGFKFGRTQDLEAIRGCVPSDYISEFELGLAM